MAKEFSLFRDRLVVNMSNRAIYTLATIGILIIAVWVAFAYNPSGTGGTPSAIGHSWDEMECNDCINTINIATDAVTSVEIADNAVVNSKIQSVNWNKLTDIPSDFGDGDITWNEISGIPTGFADGVDDDSGGGGCQTFTADSNQCGSGHYCGRTTIGKDADVWCHNKGYEFAVRYTTKGCGGYFRSWNGEGYPTYTSKIHYTTKTVWTPAHSCGSANPVLDKITCC